MFYLVGQTPIENTKDHLNHTLFFFCKNFLAERSSNASLFASNVTSFETFGVNEIPLLISPFLSLSLLQLLMAQRSRNGQGVKQALLIDGAPNDL